MSMTMGGQRSQRGVVLAIVLFFALLLSASIATFAKRATVDTMLSLHRDAAARAEALARGGVQIAKALMVDDSIRAADSDATSGLDSYEEPWARIGDVEIDAGGGAKLRLSIADCGSRLNLNALFPFGPDAQQSDRTEPFLHALLTKVIDEMPVVDRAAYELEVRELAENLIDYVDADELRIAGGLEDDYYQRQTPPYRAANRPLLSVDELGLVEGFDARLVDALRPYITVHPFVGGGGVNPNTAPPHILALIFYNDGHDLRLADEDDVRRILEVRENDQLICASQADEICIPISAILPNADSIHPPLSFSANTFTVHSEARIGEVRRSVEAVIDRTDPAAPLLLSWKVW